MVSASSSSVSSSSVVGGSGGAIFASKSRGGTSRMATGKRLGAAFDLTLRMTLRALPGVEGEVAIGPYQGSPPGAGYRLVIRTGGGQGPAFALERQTVGGGIETLATNAGPLRIEDGEERVVHWTRSAGGEIAIAIDGEEILAARDTRLSGGFDGVVLVNTGGDVEVGAIEAATRE